jgi:prolipoprotein diacylglyceryltransferase
MITSGVLRGLLIASLREKSLVSQGNVAQLALWVVPVAIVAAGFITLPSPGISSRYLRSVANLRCGGMANYGT